MKNPLWKHPGLDRLIVVMVCSVVLFLIQIVMSHVTHSLTLLAAAYHMLYNIFSLMGCIATIKMCQRGSSLSNTFGWARLEVLSTVVNLLFLFALDFSLVVEAIQTLIHSDHMDSMHRPEIICIVAGCGILLNFLCVLLIGGFTHHQGSFLALTPAGDVVVQYGVATEESVRQGLRRLNPSDKPNRLDCVDAKSEALEETEITTVISNEEELRETKHPADTRVSQRWPTLSSVFRDNASTVMALISAIVVYMNGESFTSLLIDPILTLVSVAILAFTSLPFIVQAGQILLQTTPAHIDVRELEMKLKTAFPSVVSVHDLHVWALTPNRVISTAHLVFMNESVYLQVKDPIQHFFHGQGITRVTLQPEFSKFGNLTPTPSQSCVLTCQQENCKKRTCCNYERPILDVPVEDVESSAGVVHHHHTSSKAGTPTRTRTAVVFDNGECLPLTSLASAHHDSDEDKFHHNPTDHDFPDTEIMTKEESTTVHDEIQTDQLDEYEVAKPVLSVPD